MTCTHAGTPYSGRMVTPRGTPPLGAQSLIVTGTCCASSCSVRITSSRARSEASRRNFPYWGLVGCFPNVSPANRRRVYPTVYWRSRSASPVNPLVGGANPSRGKQPHCKSSGYRHHVSRNNVTGPHEYLSSIFLRDCVGGRGRDNRASRD